MIEMERWECDSDESANWCIAKIKEEQEEIARLEKLAEAEILNIKQKFIDARKNSDSNIDFFSTQLRHYFSKVPHRMNRSKTKETYRLLNGSLEMKAPSRKIAHNDDKALVTWLKENRPEYIKVEEKPMWGEFKKELTICDGYVVDADGVPVECLSVEDVPEEFIIK